MDTDIRNFEGQRVTLLVGDRVMTGTLEHIGESVIVVDGWRVLMTRVSAWSPGLVT